MINLVITFFVLALVAGGLGFSGVAGDLTGIAKILFVVFLVLLVLSFLRGRTNLP